MDEKLEKLVAIAVRMGASKVGIISASEIIVENNLAKLCNSDPACENYGLSLSCPPHVPDPRQFREWPKQGNHAFVIRNDAVGRLAP